MQITHQEARSLIQFRADQVLNTLKKEMLNEHLRDCVECADYADEIQETEATLRITLKKHWNAHPQPLQVKDIKVKIIPSRELFDILTTRIALIGITLLFFIFAFYRFTSSNNSSYSSMPVGISAIPTPSLLLTSTQNNFNNCQMIRYEVRHDDTLEGIAHRFSASEQVIQDLNNLQADVVTLPTRLIIPVCELTPTGTTHPPTVTNTPALELITYTPG
jgi:hypothetical protein